MNRFRITSEYAQKGLDQLGGGRASWLTRLRLRVNASLAPLAVRLLRLLAGSQAKAALA